MSSPSPEVDAFLTALGHRRAAEVQALRAAVLEGDDDLVEHVKWNAPSYQRDGEDRVTFRLQPRDCVQLVLHRGAKVRADSAQHSFDDPTGLVVWRAPDRGVVTFADAEAVTAHLADVVRLVRAWVRS